MTPEQYYWFVKRPQLLRHVAAGSSLSSPSPYKPLRPLLYELHLDGFIEDYTIDVSNK